jgi:hypothetical protein
VLSVAFAVSAWGSGANGFIKTIKESVRVQEVMRCKRFPAFAPNRNVACQLAIHVCFTNGGDIIVLALSAAGSVNTATKTVPVSLCLVTRVTLPTKTSEGKLL